MQAYSNEENPPLIFKLVAKGLALHVQQAACYITRYEYTLYCAARTYGVYTYTIPTYIAIERERERERERELEKEMDRRERGER